MMRKFAHVSSRSCSREKRCDGLTTTLEYAHSFARGVFIILEFFKLLLSFPFAFPDEAAFPILEVNVFVFDALSGSSKLEFMKLVSFRDTAPPGK